MTQNLTENKQLETQIGLETRDVISRMAVIVIYFISLFFSQILNLAVSKSLFRRTEKNLRNKQAFKVVFLR